MVTFYVSKNALKDLNENGHTPIYDKDGNDTYGRIQIECGQPEIFNLLGAGETLYLDRLRVKEEYIHCVITTHGKSQRFHFEYLENEGADYITEWKAE